MVILQFNRLIRNKWIWGVFAVAISAFFAFDFLIADLRGRLGITSVVVTHDMHSALTVSDRILMLGGGHVVEISVPSDFIHSERPEVRAFLDAQFITRRGRWETPS